MSDKKIKFFKGTLSNLLILLADKFRGLISVNEDIDNITTNNNMLYGVQRGAGVDKHLIPVSKVFNHETQQWEYKTEAFGNIVLKDLQGDGIRFTGVSVDGTLIDIIDAPSDGTEYVRKDGSWSSLSKYSLYKVGFDCSQDPQYKYGISLAWDNTTKTITVTHSSGTVSFYSGNNYYSVSNGDTTLKAVVPNTTDEFVIYFNTSGQLVTATLSTYNSSQLGLTTNPVLVLAHDVDYGDEILSIKLLYDAFHSSSKRQADNFIQGLAYGGVGALITGATIGNTTGVNISSGVFFDSDTRADLNGSVGGVFPKYYLKGLNNSGNNRIKRATINNKIAILDTDVGIGTTGRPVYNIFNGTTQQYELAVLGASDFMWMHYYGANGADMVANIDYSQALGQASYNNIGDARDGIDKEVKNLAQANITIKKATLLYSVLINSSGQIVEITTGETYKDWRETYLIEGGNADYDQGINSVLQVDDNANGRGIQNLGSTTMKTTGNTSLKMESAGGVNFSEILARNLTTNAYQDLRVEANNITFFTPIFDGGSSTGEFIKLSYDNKISFRTKNVSNDSFLTINDSAGVLNWFKMDYKANMEFSVGNKSVTDRVISLYDGSNYLFSIRGDGSLLALFAQIADLASQTMSTDEINVNHLANIASAVMGDTTESTTATLHIAKRTGTGGYTVTGSLNGDYDGTYEAIADVNGYNAYQVTGKNKYLYAGEASLGGGAVGYVINDDTTGLWNSTVKFQQAVASLTNPANNFYIGIESPYTGLNASVALYGSTQNAIEAEDPILINGNEVKPVSGTMTDNYLYKYDLTNDSFVKSNAIIDDNGNLLVEGTGTLTIGVRSTDNASIFNLGTDLDVQTAYLIAYSSTHPIQPNKTFFKNRYGGVGISTGVSGSISDRMFVDNDGTISMYNLSVGLPAGKTDAGQVRITTDGELYIV